MKKARKTLYGNMVAIIQPAEEGGFYAYCPSLPGCASQGETYAQTVENITEAIQGVLYYSARSLIKSKVLCAF